MEDYRSGAALVLSGALFVFALPESPPVRQACPNPVEAASRGGNTTSVACVGDEGAVIRGPARRLFGLPIDLNCAQPETLETFPGIGKVRAQSIVADRRIRRFDSVDDLIRVHGIGPKTLERIRGEIAVATTAEGGPLDSPPCRPEGRAVPRELPEGRR